jgi:hypothetical protein
VSSYYGCAALSEDRLRCLRTGAEGRYLDLKCKKVNKGRRKFHNKDFYNLHLSQNNEIVLKCPKKSEMGKAFRTQGSDENARKILLESMKRRAHLGVIHIDRRVVLK